MNRWIAAQTQPHREQIARYNLLEQGYDVLLPVFLKERRHARKVDTVEAPLFPGYIFVEMDPRRSWAPINGTRGVTRVLATPGGSPLFVPTAIIADLQARIAAGEFAPKEKAARFRRGDVVRITSGPFTGFTGLYEGTAAQRVAVLIDMMRQKVVVRLSEGQVEAVA